MTEGPKWGQFLEALALHQFVYRSPSGAVVSLPYAIRDTIAGMAVEESGRGTTPLVVGLPGKFNPPLNFFSLKWRDDINAPFPIGRVTYTGPDGTYDYCSFRSVDECIMGLLYFLHRWPYPNIDLYLARGLDFLNYIGPHFCPPSFPGSSYFPKFYALHKNMNYAEVVYYVHRLEVRPRLIAIGWKETPLITQPPAPMPAPIPAPGSLYITDGVLKGPNVKYVWVKNYDTFNRPFTLGIVLHEPDAHGTAQDAGGLGILYDWSIKATQKSAHALIEEDGTIIQTVDFRKPAWHCNAENMRRLGFEIANIGPFWPWQEVFGWFFRFKNAPWEQRIRKSDMQLINGMYWAQYTDPQIASTKALVAACETFFGHSLAVDGHNKFNNQRVDPGPLFWEKFNR